MATWYVRPDTSHNSSLRNGTSYATAWGGWSTVVWGASGVKAGDTLYVCGSHTYSSFIQVGAHSATLGNSTVISGGYADDPGAITFTAGSYFLLIGKDYTTIKDLAVNAATSHCIYLYPTGELIGTTIQGCTLTGGVGAAILSIAAANGQKYTDLTVTDNDFLGGSGSTLGGAISWTVAASGSPISNLSRVTIHNNRFTGCAAARAVVQLRLEDGANASSGMADIVMTDNVFRNCATLGAEIVGPSLTGVPENYGRNSGIRVTGNLFYDMTNTDAAFNLGGAMGVGGFAPSLTEDFGSNIIARNKAYRITGPSGFLNLFYGAYQVFDNYAEDIIASQADGNAILIDHGCDYTVVYGNHFRRVTGNAATENSGCGIMILNAANITAYGNLVEGCKIGVYVGNKGTGQSSNVFNNTFKDCSLAGVYALSTADMATNLIRNNIFTTTDSGKPSVLIGGGVFTGESYNCYQGFGSASGHTLAASSITTDPTSAVGTYLGGKDHYGKDMPNPPPLGAVITFAERTQTNRSIAASRLIVDRSIGRRTKAG